MAFEISRQVQQIRFPNGKQIQVAATAGFCFGVARAVRLAYDAAGGGGRVCTLGPIIHNPQVVDDLARKGVRIADNVQDIMPGETVVIRSHGVGADVYEALRQGGHAFVDATCPFVAKIHWIVAQESAAGRDILIAGDPSHPEVQAIVGHLAPGGHGYVISTPDELDKLLDLHPEWVEEGPTMVSQTTFQLFLWEICKKNLKKHCTNAKIFDTICSATSDRQCEADTLAQNSDLMVVIGGRYSSNTNKLKAVCEKHCTAVMVECAADLPADIAYQDIIGVTAGASTPSYIIKEVLEAMSEMLNNAGMEEEFNFEEALEQSFKKSYTGERVKAYVTAVNAAEAIVDIGTKHTGYIPLSELTNDPGARVEDIVKVGDTIDAIVVKINDQEGTVILSKKRLDAIQGFENIMQAEEERTVLDGTVVDIVNGGVIALVEGIRVFVPASQATLRRGEDLQALLKQPVQLRIIDVDKRRKRAVGSIRSVLMDKKMEMEKKVWETIEVGNVYTGEVKSLTSYGAFVDIGGVDGMVHVTELSWKRIKHPSEVVHIGDKVEVYVKDVDKENKRISLGYKKAEDNPWEKFKQEYEVGQVVKATVVSITPFGAFARIIDGVDGLIHISQVADHKIGKVSDVLEVGQEVTVKIIEIDTEKKRISLSIRALLEDQAQQDDARAVADAADIAGVSITSDEE